MATVDYFERKLDDKRRLTIPAEIRKEFKSGVVVTRGFGKYLHMYSQEVWDQKVEPELKGHILDERTADLNVQFRTGKVATTLDEKQGRFTLELHHIEYAEIDKEVIAVRAGAYWRLQAK
jgi:MraZ protein